MFNTVKISVTPDELKKELPLSEELAKRKQNFDDEIKRNIISKEKFTVIAGPCSADSVEAVSQYLSLLKKTADKVASSVLTVARIYTAKPHSDGRGFSGLAFQKSEKDGFDIAEGLRSCRRLMLNCLKIGLPVADELLYPELYFYFSDIVSYWFLGARSSEDSLHRNFASGLDTAVGVKNSVGGGILQAVQSVYAVTLPAVFPCLGQCFASGGNAFSHLVLRGILRGDVSEKNFLPQHIDEALYSFEKYGIKNPFIVVDLSHANSGKAAAEQLINAELAAEDSRINGIIAESYLYFGRAEDAYGVSKTDECLSYEQTDELVGQIAQKFRARKK